MSSNYDAIREANIKEYGEGTRHLAFLGKLYSDRTHFLFELLQNAEDAGAPDCGRSGLTGPLSVAAAAWRGAETLDRFGQRRLIEAATGWIETARPL